MIAEKDDLIKSSQIVEAAGVVIKQSFWSRLVGKINQYSDKIGRENAATRPGPCCNKPPK